MLLQAIPKRLKMIYLVEQEADVKTIKEINTSWNDDIKNYLQSVM
jgi:hypothetical protein